MEEGTWTPPAVLTRALSFVVLVLMAAALVFAGWIALRYLGQIHV